MRKAIMRGMGGIVVSLILGYGGVSTSPALAGTLEPPADAVNEGGDPAPTMKTLDHIPPTWSQSLPADNGNQVGCNSARFKCVLGGAGILDKETGLVWEQSPLTDAVTWSNARFGCTTRTVGDRQGWRLPSVHELSSLVDPTNPGGNPDLPAGHPFNDVQSPIPFQSSIYWSATTLVEGPANAWVVSFLSGDVFFNFKTPEPLSIFAWCVRGGSPGSPAG